MKRLFTVILIILLGVVLYEGYQHIIEPSRSGYEVESPTDDDVFEPIEDESSNFPEEEDINETSDASLEQPEIEPDPLTASTGKEFDSLKKIVFANKKELAVRIEKKINQFYGYIPLIISGTVDSDEREEYISEVMNLFYSDTVRIEIIAGKKNPTKKSYLVREYIDKLIDRAFDYNIDVKKSDFDMVVVLNIDCDEEEEKCTADAKILQEYKRYKKTKGLDGLYERLYQDTTEKVITVHLERISTSEGLGFDVLLGNVKAVSIR